MNSETIVALLAIAGSITTTSLTMFFSLKEKRAGTFETATEGLERVINAQAKEIDRLNHDLESCRAKLSGGETSPN